MSKGLEPDVVKSFQSTLGLIPYNLEPGAKLLAPVITPVRNLLPRRNGGGGRNVEFKAVTSYNYTSQSGWAAEGLSGPEIQINTVDCVFPYRIASMYNYLTFEGFYTAKGQVDAKALMMANLLRALMIDEEDRLLFGNPVSPLYGASVKNSNAYAPMDQYGNPLTNQSNAAVAIGGSIGAAVTGAAALTQAASVAANGPGTYYNGTTGGFIAAGTYSLAFTALTGPDYGINSGKTQETLISTTTTTVSLTGTTNTLVVVPPSIPGAIAYALYYKPSAGSGAQWNRVVGNGRFILTNAITNGTVTPPTAENSGTANAYVGIAQQILTSANGATVIDKHLFPNATGNPYALNANPQSTNDLDTLFQTMWASAKADPDLLLLNSQESITISNSLSNTPFFVQPQGMQNETLGGYRVSRFINKVTGTFVDLRVHPTLPQGTVLALSMQMPAWYPNGDISNVWAFDYLYDYLSLEYAVTQPRLPIEVRNMGAVVGYFPLIQGAITNIALN